MVVTEIAEKVEIVPGTVIVGKSVPRVDAVEKVTGAALYTVDMSLPGMLYGKVLRSPVAHARIRKIDVSAALKLRGVRAIVTADDTPQIKFSIVPTNADKMPMEKEKVRFIGDEVAAVAAITENIAEDALDLIKVDYEELPGLYDPIEATKPGAPRIHDHVENNTVRHAHWECGNVEKGFAESDIIIEDTFTTSPQQHAPMEVHATLASFDQAGNLTVWSSTQTPHSLRQRLAIVLNMAQTKIRVIKPPVGGAFGSKTDMDPIEPICAFLARKSGKPVRITKTREEEFISSRIRHPTIVHVKLGFKQDGRLVAKDIVSYMDNGAYNSHGPAVNAYHCAFSCALYNAPNTRYDGKLVYTNKPYGGACRGYGVPQVHFPLETAMDMAADKLKIDPLELRLKNVHQPNELTVNDFKLTTMGMTECLVKATDAVKWTERRNKLPAHHGLGLANMLYTGAGSRGSGFNYSGASMRIDPDGTVNVVAGAADIGQGSNTALTQIAAEALGVRLEDVRITMSDTNTSLVEFGTFGSRVTFCVGSAILYAAKVIKAQLLETAGEMLGASPEDLELKDRRVFIKNAPEKSVSIADIATKSYYQKEKAISADGFYNGPHSPLADGVTYAGFPAPSFVAATHVAEVDVDPETGHTRVVKFVAAHDVGKVVNPMAAEGQMEGSVAMGTGWALMEGLVYKGGKVLNANLHEYKTLTALDMPPVETIFVETNDPNGPYGAKGLGESGMIPVAPAIGNAIFSAVGVRLKDLPMTAENILRSLKEQKKEEK